MDYTKESFESWLTEIPSKLKSITEDFAKKNKLNLDFSIESLDALEGWLLKQYDVATDLREEEDVLDLLALYVGETHIKHAGGEWYVDAENEKGVYYQKLGIQYEEDGELAFRSTRALCTACISRRRGNLISSTLKKTLSKK